VSTGGIDTTKEFVRQLNLCKGQSVLDVGCGIGGSAFHMAQEYGANVHGIDLSKNMICIAQDKARTQKFEDGVKVTFEVCDATKKEFPAQSFDVIYSRDAILHIYDKLSLFKQFRYWLKPGGVLFITDYCCGPKPHSKDFEEYVSQRRYHLQTPQEYGTTIELAGFIDVVAKDETQRFVSILKQELQNFEQEKQQFIQDFSEDDYNHIVDGWNSKVIRCGQGDQRWGSFMAFRPKSENELDELDELDELNELDEQDELDVD